MKKKNSNSNISPKKPLQSKSSSSNVKRMTVDIVTGKELVSVYFDPAKVKGGEMPKDLDWQGAHLYVPAAVVKEESGVLTVRLSGGEVLKMTDAVKMANQDDEGIEDILKLHNFSEMSLVHTLRVRYAKDEIYTLVGSILISLNPYKSLPRLYDERTVEKYHFQTNKRSAMQGKKDLGGLSPHLFVVAEASYASLFASKLSQSIIISGESGSGKTEGTKQIMSFLARITAMEKHHQMNNNNSANGSQTIQVGELEQRVLNTNPVLEAFGNAKTLRNDNSSRFGKVTVFYLHL